MFTAQDSRWMAQALRLAERGLYGTSPNPRVGCLLVAGEDIVGSGWHRRAGEPHAEVHALREAGNAARGATAYVTLEPCSHHGRTPPCADALIEAGVARVVVAVQDPNPQVAGEGLEKLRAAGIKVESGLMEVEARELNAGFFSRMARGIPWVRSKVAMSLDGRTALASGASKWITGEPARRDVQRWRARSCAVLTGINTILADDAQLNVRDAAAFSQTPNNVTPVSVYERGTHPEAGALEEAEDSVASLRQPLRVVLDSHLRLPFDAQVIFGGNTLVYAAVRDDQKMAMLQDLGAEVVVLSGRSGQVDLEGMLHDLAKRGCNEVLVEAGCILNGALLRAGLVDELLLYIAPQLLGETARGMVQLGELASLDQCVNMKWQDVRQVGDDLRVLVKVEKG